MHGEWRYQDSAGGAKEITRAEFDALTASGRLKEADIGAYDGGWAQIR